MFFNFFILFIVFTIIDGTLSQINNKNSNLCDTKTKCGDCIQIKSCAWCRQPEFGDKYRCFQLNETTSSMDNDYCDKNFIVHYKNEIKILSAKKLTLKANPLDSETIQITPQQINLKLRPNDSFLLNINYSQATDYPLDLYYLMDLSQSMKDDKEKLSKLGNELSETMRNITSNFRLGFGSFVDKTVMPFVAYNMSNYPGCPGVNCSKPYGFKNNLKLNTDTTTFSEKVFNATVAGNVDSPEGGFDGIMQAIVCRNEIGWREQSRKLLIFTTDAPFHSAGDGKLAGIIEPNDGKCHLNDNGEYTHSTILDFPSVSQINSKAKENSVNLIFAVTKDHFSIYNNLSKVIEGSVSAELSEDSSNVVNIVKDEYKKMTSSVELKHNGTGAIKITYKSDCLNTKEPNKCDKLNVGNVVKFVAEITVTSCPKDPNDWHQTIQIYPIGLNESLIINLEMLCSCSCEHTGDGFVPSSETCNKHGNSTCGICECDTNYVGRQCECSTLNKFKENENVSRCRPADSNVTTPDCSGRGNCDCGVCSCDKRSNPEEIISGDLCECDNFSCDRPKNLLCSHNGNCECGHCHCHSGWTGEACDCSTSIETCIEVNSGRKICSNHGKCECGKCSCDDNSDGRYYGKYCEQCSTCDRCDEFKECVMCQMYQTGLLNEKNECSKNCTDFQFNSVDKFSESLNMEHICTFSDKDGCIYSFTYQIDNETVIVNAKKKRVCHADVLTVPIVASVVGGIVLLGLGTLLLWKLLTSIHDRREFSKFENERKNAQWNSSNNPLFRLPVTTFENPTFEY